MDRCRATRESLATLRGISPEKQDQILVLAVLYVPSLLDSGPETRGRRRGCDHRGLPPSPSWGDFKCPVNTAIITQPRNTSTIRVSHGLHVKTAHVKTPTETVEDLKCSSVLLPSEYGTCKTVKARFWPWLPCASPDFSQVFPRRAEADCISVQVLQGYFAHQKTQPPRTLP